MLILIFDWAEELEYIPSNKLRKTITRIKANKKILLKESKREEDLSLDKEELKLWLQAFDIDLEKGLIDLKTTLSFIRHSFYPIENQKVMLFNGNTSISLLEKH